MKSEDVPETLVDAAYPVCLAYGIPWHDDAIKLILAATMPSYEALVRAKVADEIEAEYQRQAANGLAAGPLMLAADIARGGAR